ncbi:MAG: ABC transporter ATP-binding protein [Candidatus Liptonbacteria bacterium]|nr:ABC transporter ATP-binding protein [Candidatus Liptonbacteria bacterium]
MLLEIKNLKAGYGDLEVLKGVSLEVKGGEVVALLGPNGAGKSTLLKSIVGLTKKTDGEILWKGRDLGRLPTHALLEEGIGFVPQGRLVFPSLTVRENLEMGGYLLDHKETLEKNLESVLMRFSVLKNKIKSRAGLLSGGEQQMLAIGRSLMMSPELLILDEPSLGLAPKIMTEVFEKLKELNQGGTTLLIVEQNVRFALRYASRGYILGNGEVRFSGRVEELSDPRKMHEAFLM